MLSRRRFLLSTAASAPALALARPLTAQTDAKDTLPDNPEPFGIRLEDDMFITESGAKPFPPKAPAWSILLAEPAALF